MVQDSPGPVLASGDLFNAFQAKDCLEQTGAAGVMFARGALNNPAVFAQLTRLVLAGRLDPSSGPTKGVGSMSAILRRHGQLYRRYEPSGRGLLKLRFFVQRYTKGLPGAKWLRLAILDCNDWEGFERLLDDWQRSYQKSE
jgi:tRNA-dihydrouridine synthase B